MNLKTCPVHGWLYEGGTEPCCCQMENWTPKPAVRAAVLQSAASAVQREADVEELAALQRYKMLRKRA